MFETARAHVGKEFGQPAALHVQAVDAENSLDEGIALHHASVAVDDDDPRPHIVEHFAMKLECLAQVLGGALALFEIRQPLHQGRLRTPTTGNLGLRCVVEIVNGLGAQHGHGIGQQDIEKRLGRELAPIELAHAKRGAVAKKSAHSAFLCKQSLGPLGLAQKPRHLAGHAQSAPAIGQSHGGRRVHLIEHPCKGIAGTACIHLLRGQKDDLFTEFGVIDIHPRIPQHRAHSLGRAHVVDVEHALPLFETRAYERGQDRLVLLFAGIDEARMVAYAQIVHGTQSARARPVCAYLHPSICCACHRVSSGLSARAGPV